MRFKVLFFFSACIQGACLIFTYSLKAEEVAAFGGQPPITADIFGKKGGYVHPFISLSEIYSDNLYRSPENKIEDFGTYIMPGVWVALPGLKVSLTPVETSTITPGGMTLEPFDYQSYRRFLVYFSGGMNMERYAEHTDENTTSNTMETRLRYQMKNNTAFEIQGQRCGTHEQRGAGFASTLEDYTSDYLMASVSFDPRGKLALNADYTTFNVDYDSNLYRFRDRVDRSFSFELAYPVLPKTRLFLEYTLIDIDYRMALREGSKENQYAMGLKWNFSEKTRGILKSGYGARTFDSPDTESIDDYIIEGRISHALSSDTRLSLAAYKKYQETLFADTDYLDSIGVTGTCLYELTSKIFLDLKILYTTGDYYGSGKKTGEEKRFSVSPAAGYTFAKWMTFTLEYTFENRSSSYATGSRQAGSNTILLNINAGV